MREIKFRAWHNERKAMLPVSSWHFFDNTIWIESGESDKYGKLYRPYKADTEVIVMQYTGLKDKNGVEIYVGDLVAVADYANWEGLYKIIWDEKNLMYMLEDAYGDKEKMCEFEHYLIRGNIYENPELLERG